MKQKLFFLMAFIALTLGSSSYGQVGPEPPPAWEEEGPEPPPAAPINKSIYILISTAVAFGYKLHADKNKLK